MCDRPPNAVAVEESRRVMEMKEGERGSNMSVEGGGDRGVEEEEMRVERGSTWRMSSPFNSASDMAPSDARHWGAGDGNDQQRREG